MDAETREEILACMRELENQPNHAQHVTRLALEIFNGLAPLHGLGAAEGLLLEAAGYLHDIGHIHDEMGLRHHKESARLIRERQWKHLTPAEAEIIAQVARYHRKATPRLKHLEFARLSNHDQDLVKTLAAILRIADSLDRNHEQFIKSVRVQILPHRLIFGLELNGPFLREVQSAYKRADLAEAVFEREVLFMAGEKKIGPPAVKVKD